MSTIERFTALIGTPGRIDQHDAIAASRAAFIDTLSCMFAGATSEVTARTLKAVMAWGPGSSAVIGRAEGLNPPFAALVNGASAHAHNYDDFDQPANAHPSAVIFPALLALAAERPVCGMDILDAHIVGVEVMQRLGEAMNMEHYRRGWLSTLTLGSIGATAACARLGRFNEATASAALSLSVSMASGLTNQGGFLAKQLHPGLAAKNGVMASSLAAFGITASSSAIDGSISLATTMGDYRQERFEAALDKLGDPWSISEFGLFTKAYPSCGYTHRITDAAINIHHQLRSDTGCIRSVTISIPDYYLDLLVYPDPATPAEAMFSAQYSVGFALLHGSFGFSALSDGAIASTELERRRARTTVLPRRPRDPDLPYDPVDPDWVEVQMEDGTGHRSEIPLATGSPARPMSPDRLRAKSDECTEAHADRIDRDELWALLSRIDEFEELDFLTGNSGSGLAGPSPGDGAGPVPRAKGRR